METEDERIRKLFIDCTFSIKIGLWAYRQTYLKSKQHWKQANKMLANHNEITYPFKHNKQYFKSSFSRIFYQFVASAGHSLSNASNPICTVYEMHFPTEPPRIVHMKWIAENAWAHLFANSTQNTNT